MPTEVQCSLKSCEKYKINCTATLSKINTGPQFLLDAHGVNLLKSVQHNIENIYYATTQLLLCSLYDDFWICTVYISDLFMM